MTGSAASSVAFRSSHSLPIGLARDAQHIAPSSTKSTSATISEDGHPVPAKAYPSPLPGSVSKSRSKRATAQKQLSLLTSNMTSTSSTSSSSPGASSQNSSKLHKRCSSASSLPGGGPSLTPQTSTASAYPTPFATLEEFPLDQGSPVVTSPSSISAVAKAKAYRHRRSLSREDQGQLDLSKSTAENARLAGLGIQHVGTKYASDVDFNRTMRRGAHVRAQSATFGTSQSSATGPRAAQPFVHPMRQIPRPYTPPLAGSYASSLNEDEVDESADVIEENLYIAAAFRNKRSMSLSSAPAIPPTPLSQSYTPDEAESKDLPYPRNSASQSNLSMGSERSGQYQVSRPNRPRRDTDLSFDHSTAPSSRTSLERSVSGMLRRTSEDAGTRDDRIKAARRRFQEKEAEKDRKIEQSAIKRRETELAKSSRKQEQRRAKSEVSVRSQSLSFGISKLSSTVDMSPSEDINELGRGRLDSEPAANLPIRGRTQRQSEINEKPSLTAKEAIVQKPHSNWLRFSGWVQTRMMNCAR